MKEKLIAIILILSAAQAYSQNKVGTTAVPFLGIGAGPAAIGMGGAFTAVATDPSALYWNPGGISRIGQTGALLEHTNYLVGTSYNYFAGVVAFDEDNAVGLSITDLNYGSDIVTTVENPDGTGETWSASDWAIGLTYARNLTDRFSIGGTAKMIMENIYRESSTGWALDAGLLYITPFNDMKIGMEISNFGTDMQLSGSDLLITYDPDKSLAGNNKNIPAQYYTESAPLPLFFRVGLAMDVVKGNDNRLTLAVDAIHPSDNLQSVNVGAEYSWNNLLFARAGYKSLFLPNTQEGLTLGVGLRYEITSLLTVKLDYGYEDFGILKNLQEFALTVGF
ncbi:MAG TPA: PorV/PorQ family protein [Candidatus Acidoferrales bacterium]|nr:PorV/PorQ family protein [Candidatus Acidoferrales bacterium]